MMENAVLFLTYNQIQKFIKASTSSSSPGGTYTDDTPLTIGQLSIAGALSGACVSLILTPVELIKCQMQVQELQMGAYGISPKASAAANAVPKSAVPAAATASSGNTRIRSMMPGDGGHGTRRWFNSFVGFPASTSNMAGGVSIARTSAISRVFSPLSIFAQSSFQPFVRSPTAASTGAHNVPKAAVAPAEAAAPPRQSSLATLFNIVREHGVRGLYRGTTWTLVRETGGGAAWFGVYEGTCRLMLNHDLIIDRYIQGNTGYAAAAAHHQQAKWVEDKRQLKPWQLAAAGGLAGVAFNASFFPADVLKSIYQTRSHSELEAMLSSNGMKPTASSSSLFGRMLGNRTRVFRGLCADVYRREGIRGFYNGMGITLARAIPSNAVIFLTYEMLSRHFEGK